MSNSPRPPGTPCCPARDHLNTPICNLMDRPASRERSEQWAVLLERWADACPCTRRVTAA
ncbi:hypothetical protein ABZ379_33215 [Streptomyces canus]|uniref:hypothetical protein n=1 Tax=Streptomyces canus TaxID=58343 RepID=UPI0033CBFDEC